jgi:uncharacterized protein HemY
MRWILCALLAAGCGPRVSTLDQAERFLRTGRARDALGLYVDLASSADAKVKVQAATGAARAAQKLHDTIAARRWLERAVALPDTPDASEEAYFEYAELLRADGDKPRALNYYYRAAAGAQAHRAGGYPYQLAVQAIAVLSTAP